MVTRMLSFLNTVANALGSVFFAPIAWAPGWLSSTLIAVVSGVVMLWAFKYTSNQGAISRVRDRIKANMLALSLFQDSVLVSLKAQARILQGGLTLMALAIQPLAIMLLPMLLLLGQLSLWYQARPLRVGEEALLTVVTRTEGDARSVSLETGAHVAIKAGPVHMPDLRQVCWRISPLKEGGANIVLTDGQSRYEKSLAVGDGFARTSLFRPGPTWSDMLFHPAEPPLTPESGVQSISIEYPAREGITCGTDNWFLYWCAVSLVAAFAAKPLLNVKI